MRPPKRLLAALALIAVFGLSGLPSAQADGPRGFGPSGHSRGFHDGFRPGFPHRGGGFRDDFGRHRNPRFCWCGFDFYRNRGPHHHHHDRFHRSPSFPHRGSF